MTVIHLFGRGEDDGKYKAIIGCVCMQAKGQSHISDDGVVSNTQIVFPGYWRTWGRKVQSIVGNKSMNLWKQI